VSIVDCPNLTKEPLTFPVKGICGKTRIAEVGGAGPFQTLGFNSEFMPVVQTESEHKPPVNGSYLAPVNSAEGGCLLEKYSEKYHDLGCALLANLFASEGQPGKVIEVKAKRRTGKLKNGRYFRDSEEKSEDSHYASRIFFLPIEL
ncbi:hypothetical protein EI555_007722, partial [Monodon monoceros]